jgi:hypothetical protein
VESSPFHQHGEVLEAQAKVAFDVEARIKQVILGMRKAWVLLAEDLHRVHDLKLWADLGHQSFEQWLASPEIDLERRWVYELIAMWRELVINRGVQPEQLSDVQVSKVREVLPAIRRGYVDIPDALAHCRTLGRDDLRRQYQQLDMNGGAPTGLDATREPARERCPTCGSWVDRRTA